MRTPTHISFGLFSGSIIASFSSSNWDVEFGMNTLTLASFASAVLGSGLPDIDNQHAPISKILPLVSRFIRRRWPHRTLMHSLPGVLISGVFFFLLLKLINSIPQYLGITVEITQISLLTMIFSFAFFSHIVLDTCTKQGARWLYPLIPNPFGFPSLEQYRFTTGDKRAEMAITILSLGLFLLYAPIARQGAEVTLSNVIGQFEQLRELHFSAVNKEVLLDFEGYYENSKAPVSGRALILSATKLYFIIFWNNSIYHIGRDEGNIRLLKGRCSFLHHPPQEKSIVYRNSQFAGILSDINGQVLISGHLDANRTFEVRESFNERTLTVSAKSLHMEFTSKEELEALQIKPQKKEMSATEIQEQVQQKKALLDSLILQRQNTYDLYQRDFLFTQIKEQRDDLKSLEGKLDKVADQEKELLFSGKIALRTLPDF